MTLKKTFTYLIQCMAAFMLFQPGIDKIAGVPQVIGLFTHLGMEPEGRIIIGFIEMLAAVLLVIPQSGLSGAFLGLGVMTGAIIGHLTVIGYGGVEKAGFVFLCCLLTIYLRRHESTIFKNMFDQ